MRKAVSLFTLAAVVAAWWWLGRAVPLPPSPLAIGEKLYCLSYAPFRGAQTPLDISTRIEPWQIDQDLAELSEVTDCVRTYSVDYGLDRVPEIARRHGLKVMLGLWVSSHTDRTQYQLTTGIARARQFPDTVRALIVGNEALLRGEVSPETLAAYIRSVKAQVSIPVTYADVWEFWLRYRELASTVDFVTIHILPYWEDEPVAARDAADHVDVIRKRVVAQFEGKEVIVGEVGWPSAGRMRAGALPSPANQARVLTEVLARGKRDGFRVNVIEAYDQPWKRFLEGTVGGHWGLFDATTRARKFVWGAPLSDHPRWPWQATGGAALTALVFGVGFFMRRSPERGAWLAVAVVALIAGVLSGWTLANVPIESLGPGGWLRSLMLASVAVAAPLAGAAALAGGDAVPTFAQVIGPRGDRARDFLSRVLGLLLLVLTVVALEEALALCFDPRYRDFPFAPLTAATAPFALRTLVPPRLTGRHAVAELAAALVLLLCAAFIVWNETLANWQALWFASALALLAVSLFRARGAPG